MPEVVFARSPDDQPGFCVTSPESKGQHLGSPAKMEDWELIDKQWFPSVYQQWMEHSDEFNFDIDREDFQFKCVYVFRCRITGRIDVREVTGPN